MELSLADQYYLKALDDYSYNLESVMENLQYALSYDDEHTQAWCLMGQLYMFQLKDYPRAQHSFNTALSCDLTYPDTYKYLSLLYIWLGKYDQAQKLINHGLKVPGMDRTILFVHLSNICEFKGQLAQAKKYLRRAKLIVIHKQWIVKIDCDLKRINQKQKCLRKSKKKFRKKLSKATR